MLINKLNSTMSLKKSSIVYLIISLTLLSQSGCEVNNPESSKEKEIISPIPLQVPEYVPKVIYVSLEPQISPPASLDAPPETGWPEIGQEVTWQAHVYNFENFTINEVSYFWYVAGNLVSADTSSLVSGETKIKFVQPWNNINEEIKFVLQMNDTANGIIIDSLIFRTKDLSVGLSIEKQIYDWMIDNENIERFELWAKKQIEQWNKTLSGVKGSIEGFEFSSNNGLNDRLRLEQIEVLPDGSPHPSDIKTDVYWYFNTRIQSLSFLNIDKPRNDQTVVLHELLHQRGLIDLYAYEVFHDNSFGSEVKILDPDGNLAAGSNRMPFVRGNSVIDGYSVYTPPFDKVLMGSDISFPSRITEHSIYGLNLFNGLRTPRPDDRREWSLFMHNNPYVSHVPKRMELILSMQDGELLKNVFLDVFFDKGTRIYEDVYLEEPDFTIESNSSGVAILTSEPWEDTSWKKRYGAASVIILRARLADNSKWGYNFLPVYDLNMAYINGNTEVAQFKLTVELE